MMRKVRPVDDVIKELHSKKTNIRNSAIKELLRRGTAAVPALIRELGSADPKRRSASASVLGRMGAPAVPELIKALKAKGHRQEGAAQALGLTRSRKAIAPLIKALGSTNVNLSLTAANALAAIGKPAIPSLLTELNHLSWRVRWGVVEALRILKPTKAITPLARLLKTERIGDVREKAVRALGAIGSKKAVSPLTDTLNRDKNVDVRIAAAQELGKRVEDRALSFSQIIKVENGIKKLAASTKGTKNADLYRETLDEIAGQIILAKKIALTMKPSLRRRRF